MFFLIVHTITGKYYPNFLTQFILGCVCYIFFFFIIKDLITDFNYDKYKYYIISLIMVDLILLVYLTRGAKKASLFNKIENKNSTKIYYNRSQNNTLSYDLSEISDENDYKVTHDLSSSENLYNIFSTTDESANNSNNNSTNSINNYNCNTNDKSEESHQCIKFYHINSSNTSEISEKSEKSDQLHSHIQTTSATISLENVINLNADSNSNE